MLVTNFKVFISRNGSGNISYSKNKLNYKVIIYKEDKILKEIFDKYYFQLEQFKLRHYAIAKWIARDIRKEGYTFKAFASNKQNIRPIKIKSNIKN
ncbi:MULTISPECIES: hypothetical protein [Flavobacteriaceae]|uniref:Uncharacterized protein n=2 Tax=Flavobacteriaceae TaxID=49546 RepID=A0A4Y8AUS3_9FLAO|nr:MULTISPECIES: hypothetical protein [Flavobacteriaceae]TEW75120.1 hypothetical protein E2488_06250 [Gramella jeungdoensis]GGK41426.1 hypothetical protein GCM10007963_06800 [Lutibacter litoralis]